MLIVVTLSIVVFSVITAENPFIKFFLRLLLVPLIAGISYEVLKFTAKHQNNPLIKLLVTPGIWLQYVTTRRPDRAQIEVAIASLKALAGKS